MIEHETATLESCLDGIIQDDDQHCRWLNTLSMMENVGAHNIVRGAHPFAVTETVLKHAAEETRHAYYLKRQIHKLNAECCPDYAPEHLLNARPSYQYIRRIDARVSRLLRDKLALSGPSLRYHAYVLVTYAVEVRAEQMYGIYQKCLKAHESPVSVRGILVEEEQHLADMESEIDVLFSDSDYWLAAVTEIEQAVFSPWLEGLQLEIAPKARELVA